MSSIKIKNLPEKIDDLNDEDLLVIEDIQDTKKISLIKLKTAFSMDGILISIKNMLSEKVNSFIESHSTKYKDLEDRNKQLEVTCHNLENQHIHDAERIFALEDRLEIEKNNVSLLLEEKERLSILLSQLETDKDILKQRIQELNTLLSNNKSSIKTLETVFEELRIKSTELENTNKELQNLLNTLEKESNDKINNQFNDVNTTLSDSVNDLLKYIRYYHPDVDDIFNL